jgi:hypothetical protein
MTDEQFFQMFPQRQTRIRKPGLDLAKDKQRSVRYLSECELEFRSLGQHDADRRRIILYKLPKDNPMFDPDKPQILKIPFLAFADETIEDLDDVLLPIVAGIMENAARRA